MKKLLKHMKLIHFIFLFLGGVMLISALPFKTQYNKIYVNYDGASAESAVATATNARGQDQTMLFEFYEKKGLDFNNFKGTVIDFQNALNDVNNLILIFGLVMVLAVCLLFVFQNANRKIYYGSNVASALLVCGGVIAFAVIVMLKLVGLMGTLNGNLELFQNVSLLQDPETRAQVLNGASVASGVSATTFLVYIVMFIVCIVYALFVLILTFAKFSRTKERRMKIIKKAAENND